MEWECEIPGQKGSIWEGGSYPLEIRFPAGFPVNPPICIFKPPIPHPNVFSCGTVCLSILTRDWKPAISLKEILLGIQRLLDEPNPGSVANHKAYELFAKSKKKYEETIKEWAKKYSQVPDESADVIVL